MVTLIQIDISRGHFGDQIEAICDEELSLFG